MFYFFIIKNKNCEEKYYNIKKKEISGIVIAKSVDKVNHGMKKITLKTNEWFYCGGELTDFWNATEIGDSVLKPQQSLTYRLYKKDTILDFEVECSGN